MTMLVAVRGAVGRRALWSAVLGSRQTTTRPWLPVDVARSRAPPACAACAACAQARGISSHAAALKPGSGDGVGSQGVEGDATLPLALGPVRAFYDDQVHHDYLQENATQIALCDALDALLTHVNATIPAGTPPLHAAQRSAASLWSAPKRLLGALGLSGAKKTTNLSDVPPHSQGLYIWGSVGSGKTMLMDVFFDKVETERKLRSHFHSFMLDVHSRIHEKKLAGIADPMPPVADDLLSEAQVLCFDEFQVTDVADAMILKRLFTLLFERGVIFVATSNRPPEDLYKGGLQRSQFLPCISLIKKQTRIISMSSEIDYRLGGNLTLHPDRTYLHPLTQDNKKAFHDLYAAMCAQEGVDPEPFTIHFKGRSLEVPSRAGGVALFHFDDVCNKPVSAGDFLKLVEHFHTIFVSDVPKMTMRHKDAARRFITLVDCLYDNGKRLVCTAETDPKQLFQGTVASASDLIHDDARMLMDDLSIGVSEAAESSLFTGEDEVFAFQRAVSRIHQMQTSQYWELANNNHQQQQHHHTTTIPSTPAQ